MLSGRSNVPENIAKSPAVQGTLKERPLPRLLQQLHRKKFTGRFVVTDQTHDQSEVFMREGMLVHVGRPVDTDRLDNLLVEYGLVSAEIVARASQQVTDGIRLGEVLDRMGALDKVKLAQVLKSQLLRKLTRLFFVTDGSYAVYLDPHGYGEGSDLALMRVDPRTVLYPGIRAAYDLPRVTQELTRLSGQRFHLSQVSSGFIAALGVPAQDSTVESLRDVWLTLDDLDGITARPLEVRSIVLALYYCDLLEREPVAEAPADSAVPRQVRFTQSADSGVFKLPSNYGPALPAVSPAAAAEAPSGEPNPLPKPSFPHASPVAPSRAAVVSPSVAVVNPASQGPISPPSHVRPNVPGETVQALPVRKAPSGTFTAATAASLASFASSPPTGSGPAPAGATQTAPASRQPVATARTDGKPSSSTAVENAPRVTSPSPSAEAMRATVQEMAQKLDRINHFEALGVSQHATADEVSTAFVRAARQFHPDRLTSAGLVDLQPIAERILARINEAAMVLGDATRRAEYVASLAGGSQAMRANLPTVLEAENSFLKGEVFLKKGDHAKAIECFTLATQGNPSEPQYQAYLAWARFDDPRTRKEVIVRETLKIMEGVVRERPRFARGYYWLGLLWKFLNEPSRAEHAFRETVAVDSGFIDASRELRLIEMRKNKAPAGKPEAPRGGFMDRFFKK